MWLARMVVEFVIVVFVVARLSRLGAEDIIMEPFRMWAIGKLPKTGYGRLFGRGIVCRWCWSVWMAIPVVLGWWLISDTSHLWDRWYADVPGMILAVSYATALTQRLEPED